MISINASDAGHASDASKTSASISRLSSFSFGIDNFIWLGTTYVILVLPLLLTTLMVGKMTTLIKRFLNLLDRIPTFGVFVARQGR